jgi:hypothetical protein
MQRGSDWNALDYGFIGHECRCTSQQRGVEERDVGNRRSEGWSAAALIGRQLTREGSVAPFLSLTNLLSAVFSFIPLPPGCAREKPKVGRSFVRPCLVALPNT